MASALVACREAPPERLFEQGRNALEERRWDDARAAFAAVLEQDPEDVAALRWAGVAWSSGVEQSAGRALSYLEPYLATGPDDDEARLMAVRWLVFSGDREGARALAADLAPGFEAAAVRANLVLEDDVEAAREAAAEALEAAPDHAGAHALVSLVSERAGDLDRALEHARLAVALDPLSSAHHYRLGLLLRRAGDLEGARAALADQQMVARLGGEGSLRTPTPVESLRLLRALAPRVASDAPSFRVRLLRLLIDTGRTEEALAVLDELAPSADDVLSLASAAREVGAAQRANEWVGSTCADPRTPSASVRREACFQSASIALAAGDTASAAEVVSDVLARDPWVARFHRLRSRLAAARGDTDAEVGALEETLALAPWRDADRLALAERLLVLGRDREARRWVEGAPTSSADLDALARAEGWTP